MTIEERRNLVAERYRARGYSVVQEPTPEELPPFARDFKVEILAKRGDGSVIASLKNSQRELESDREVPRYAEIIEKQPGWRFDLVVLGPEVTTIPEKFEAKEPSEEDIHRALDEVERMLQAGFVSQGFIAAWAVMESAMRLRIRAEGGPVRWGSSPRTLLNELYSNGMLSIADFRELERLLQTRHAIVHGFASPAPEVSSARFLAETTRVLLDESRTATTTA